MENWLIIFDVGGVVCRNFDVAPAIADHLGISEARFYKLAGKNNLRLLYCGELSIEDFWEKFSRAYEGEITQDLWEKFYHPRLRKEVIKTVKRLKKSNRVVAGTNAVEPHYEINKNKGYYRLFDGVYASNKIGVAKPDPGFYKQILDSEDYEPSEVFFIDDQRRNLKTAQDLGINTVLFRGTETLETIEENISVTG